ncbi:putative glucan endo-1,3-beta-glucosidase BG4 [Silene latifolia]|uniref:putative glucan endo-1,3-beta-glucosidase BG4 n=1 Tax=Silene latifolia TaxID=37657 RepID=UPI003D77337A
MASRSRLLLSLVLYCLLATSYTNVTGDGDYLSKDIGVCYGFNGDNLPSPNALVTMLKRYGIGKLRIFEPNLPLQDALKGSDIDLVLGVKNQDIPTLASSLEASEQWVATNVLPYVNDIAIPYVSVGNEVVPGQFSDGIVPAMQNLQNVLLSHNLQGMRATTVVHMDVLTNTYPPSAATFSEASMPYMTAILQHLQDVGAPLLFNIYPYFVYASNPTDVRLDYAQFTATGPVISDGNLTYMNLFDAMVDSVFWAMEKIGVTDVDLVVSESGWPHDGNGEFTTVDLAGTYNKNYMNHVLSHVGTPKKPGAYIEGFIFSMVDEDLKPAGVEQNFGMFKPNLVPNFNIFA